MRFFYHLELCKICQHLFYLYIHMILLICAVVQPKFKIGIILILLFGSCQMSRFNGFLLEFTLTVIDDNLDKMLLS